MGITIKTPDPPKLDVSEGIRFWVAYTDCTPDRIESLCLSALDFYMSPKDIKGVVISDTQVEVVRFECAVSPDYILFAADVYKVWGDKLLRHRTAGAGMARLHDADKVSDIFKDKLKNQGKQIAIVLGKFDGTIAVFV